MCRQFSCLARSKVPSHSEPQLEDWVCLIVNLGPSSAAGGQQVEACVYRLIQELLAAKRDLDLPRRLRRLDNFDFLLLDDLGYLPQGAQESEVLFTLIAERYERRSLGITSNLVFSEWERIFGNPMATAAAITGSSITPSSWISTSPATAPTTPSNGVRIRR